MRILAGRSNANRPGCETRRFVQPSRNLPEITRVNNAEELEQRIVAGSIEARTCLRHSHRMPDPT
jgi:hypothetical protein